MKSYIKMWLNATKVGQQTILGQFNLIAFNLNVNVQLSKNITFCLH